MKEGGIGVHSLTRIEGVLEFQDGTRRSWEASFTHTSLHKTHTKPTQGGQCIVETLLVLGQTTNNTNTQDSPQPELGGSHHLPPYSILYGWPQSPHSNGFLSRDSQMGVLKSPKLGLPRLWNPIILLANLWSRCNLKQSCSSHREFSKVYCTPFTNK